MAFTDYLLTGPGEFSLMFAPQSSGLLTPATTGWEAIDCLIPSLTWEVEEADEPKSSGQRGARSKKSVGRKIGTLAFRCEMPGQALDFDASSGAPTAVGAWKLVEGALGGTAVGAYLSPGVAAGAAANEFAVQSGTTKLGCAYAGGAAAAIKGIGWVESVDTVTATLRHDMRAIFAEDDAVFPLHTMFEAVTQPVPQTFRLVGDIAYHDYRLNGCMPSALSFNWDSGGRLWCDFEFKVYASETKAAAGGVVAITPRKQISEWSGRGNAHLVIASNIITAQDDGTANPMGMCGTSGHSIQLTFPHKLVECPGAIERVGACHVRAPELSVSFNVEVTPEWDDEDSDFLYKAAYQNQTPIDYAMSVGAQSGTLFAFAMSAGLVQNYPTPAEADGAWTAPITLAPGAYAGDGASTDAGRQPFAFAIG